MGLKLLNILKEESISKIEKDKLVEKMKLFLLTSYPNMDINLFLEKFYMVYPNNEKMKKYFKNGDIHVYKISKQNFYDILNCSDMFEFLNKILKIKTIKNILSRIKSDNTITIYRAMSVDEDWFTKLKNKQIKRLGIYWSWFRGEPVYAEEKEFLIELVCDIDEKYINWPQTIIQNVFYDDTENEITLFKNTPIKLTKILYQNFRNDNDDDLKELDKSFFIGQTFLV